eukprot:Nitzschia sp. Nitz4//scaffold55_size114948//37568//41472//NITZ4_003894-RA/size114948-augustus-gene-0.69-mRNA-1//-1//CDS//3329554509//2225//frame0
MDMNPLKGLKTLEEGSYGAESNSSNRGSTSTGSERDEVQEVRKVSKRETARVSQWRLIATGVLLLTAVAVTLTTYWFLERQRKQSFETQCNQFSRTVSEAAMAQMQRARAAQWGFTRSLSAYVYENEPGAWPFFHMPRYAMYGNDLRQQGHLENFAPFVRVERDQLEEWEKVGFLTMKERETYWAGFVCAPAPYSYGLINWWNVGSNDVYGPMIEAMVDMKYDPVLSPVKPYEVAIRTMHSREEHEEMHTDLDILDGSPASPHSFWGFPVYENPLDKESRIVATHLAAMAWDVFLLGLLPEGVRGITVVVDNTCDQSFTFELDGPRVRYVGEGRWHSSVLCCIFSNGKISTSVGPAIAGDYHDRSFDYLETYQDLMEGSYTSSDFTTTKGHCLLDIRKKGGALGLKGFMSGELTAEEDMHSKPLADLFLECTIMFADIAGFTAWSSMREPSQVFTILETLYGAFDQIAKSRKVLKVETVGDCYVAASGIPDYRCEHAVIMVKFARDILAKMVSLTKELEVTLGPDTGDLSLHIGVHSGPVTGGVLHGERSCFQLFGDTMNMCSRVESTGTAGRIQLSVECAQQLIANGKEHWLIKREEKVQAKGKGEIQMYWLGMGCCNDDRRASSSVSSGELLGVYEPMEEDLNSPTMMRIFPEAKTSRLVDWNVQMLSDIVKAIVARRRTKEIHIASTSHGSIGEDSVKEPLQRRDSPPEMYVEKNFGFENSRPLDEVQEIIHLPEFDVAVAHRAQDPSKIELDTEVMNQLRNFCADISSCYNDNWFHNFAHASHVTMSVVKLLSRIVAPTESTENEISLHDHTYGITSDPLTQFACAFAAMIHDVNHVGVPNSQLVKEEARRIATVFGDHSVAEQNSVVVAWDMFMSEEYDLLRSTLCATETELTRFRQLVVNSVMATGTLDCWAEESVLLDFYGQHPYHRCLVADIVDKDLKNLRNARWEKAFSKTDKACEDFSRADIDRKATIVIEHLLEASDVAHTMQHWHVYRKWNERFFRECMTAYLNGQADKNPCENWYKGELGFFDFYVIPLTKKLKDCGVFGKSSDEYLTYAKPTEKSGNFGAKTSSGK